MNRKRWIVRTLGVFLFLLNLCAALALVFAYLSTHVSPVNVWVFAFFGLAYPYILVVNIAFVLLWLLTRWKTAMMSLVVILLGFNHLQNYFRFKERTTDKEGLVVCSYNVRHFYEKPVRGKSVSKEVQDYLYSKRADIVCLQETDGMAMDNFRPIPPDSSGKSARFYRLFPGNRNGPAIFSRYRFVNTGEINFGESQNMVLFADAVIGEDTVRVYSCHLQSFHISDDSLDEISREGNRVQSARKVRQLVSRLKRAYSRRSVHAEGLAEHISRSPYPVIVCGDFNDTPVSYTYHTIRKSLALADAFVESGSLLGNSYRGKLPSYRIDYILHSRDFDAYNFIVDHVDYSDHYPISCKLIKTRIE